MRRSCLASTTGDVRTNFCSRFEGAKKNCFRKSHLSSLGPRSTVCLQSGALFRVCMFMSCLFGSSSQGSWASGFCAARVGRRGKMAGLGREMLLCSFRHIKMKFKNIYIYDIYLGYLCLYISTIAPAVPLEKPGLEHFVPRRNCSCGQAAALPTGQPTNWAGMALSTDKLQLRPRASLYCPALSTDKLQLCPRASRRV